MLRAGLVDGDDGEAELAFGLERTEPDHAGRRLLGPCDHVAELLATERVENPDHVGAVVHRDVRPVVDRRLEVRVVGVVVLALDRERADPVLVDEGGRDVILRRKGVRGAQDDIRAAGLEGAHQVRGLGRDVQARGDAVALERLLALEALANCRENGHLPVGPFDPADALCSQGKVFHIVSLSRSHRQVSLSVW